MYIKQVSIKGFRSYKDLVILGPLEQGQNIIVGVNGSGKSNVLNAIQFVLGDEFTHLQVESRMALLHDTADNNDEAVAFVEIVFDDSEGKLSINSDIVKIKRILTPKKDQCFLNDKCVTKSEITTILESTGFSRSNPYYVVKQGQISQLAVASDFSRLQLIYDVAGIKVYDARKNESARVLAEAQEKHAKAKLILDSIDKRIDAVKAEKEIFQKFEDLTMSSKAINHILIDKEISSINNKLSSLEEGSESYRILSTDLRSQIAQTSQETELCAAEMSSIEGKLNEIGILRQQVNKDIADLLNNKTNLEHKLADIKEKQERIANTSNLLKACESDEAKLLSEISDYDNQLKQVDKTLQEKDILINKLELSKRTLLDKSGRLDQFKSEAERNKWLNERILNVKKDLNNYKTETVAVSDFILANESSIVELESAKSAKRAQILENDDKIRKLNDEIHANKTDLNRLVTDRTDNWKNLLSKKRSIELLNADLKNADNKFRSITGKGIQNGIDSLNAFLNELECDGSYGELVSGYYGTLVENFKCDDVFNAAVESIAGSRLFYHVVKTDQIATRLIKEFNRRKFKGELNFLPLNVLSAKKHEQINNPNVCPLISKLKYDKKIERAVEFVFIRVFLCKNLEIAGDISSEHNVDCVTLEGDQVSRRGSMTGGYRDIRSSKLDLMKNILQLKKTLHDLNQVVVEYTTDVQSIESEINRIEHLLQSQHNELNNLSSIGIKYKEEFQNTEESKKRIYELIADKKRILQTLRNNSQGKRKELNTLQGDLTSPFISELSTADRCERDHITNDILKLNKEIQNLSNKKFEIESTLKNLRFNMDNTITKKKCQLMEGCDQTETDEHQILIEISKLCDAIQEKQTKMNEFEMQEKECQESQNLYRSKIQLLKSKEEDISVKLNETVLELNKVAAKEKMFSDQRKLCEDRIQELGSILPSDIEKHKHLNTNELTETLKGYQSKINKCGTVNMHAVYQCNEFLEQRQELIIRMKQLDADKAAVVQLLDTLDAKKNQAIQATLTKVSSNFSQILRRLIPSAKGSLILRRSTENNNSEESQTTISSSFDQYNQLHIDCFTGVGIKVKFSETDSEITSIQHLSGGQKTVLALVLIFAIQKCDPAPFYLFDEIDQSLDFGHRARVAKFITEECKDSQFISTSFRPELLDGASTFFEISQQNRISHIRKISKDEALAVVNSGFAES